MCITTSNTSYMADAIDFELDRSGRYIPAVVSGTYSLVDKLITSFAAVIATGAVALLGYTTTMPQPTDPCTSAIFWMTLSLKFGLPLIGWVITLVAMRECPLTKEEMVNVQKRIAEKRLLRSLSSIKTASVSPLTKAERVCSLFGSLKLKPPIRSYSMSKAILLNTGWTFTKEGHDEPVTLPHTWNAVDGQDGGNDYYRGTCSYTRKLEKPELSDGDRAVLQFDGVAMTAVVSLNGEKVAEHKGGYSTFRVDITDALHDGANELIVSVDNSDNDTVYPQKADFTFYGGIYRDVTLHVVPAAHFALAENGAVPVKVTPAVTDLAERRCEVTVEAFVVGAQSVNFTLDGQQTSAAVKDGTARAVFTLEHARLWDGLDDPYLYTVTARLDNGETATTRFGCRKFEIDPQKGFF